MGDRMKRLTVVASLAAFAAMAVSAAPAQAAFPGKPGPIAYAKVFVGETEAEYSGGLVAHGPHPDQSPRPLTEGFDSNPTYSADGQWIAFASKRHTRGERRGGHIFVMRSDGSGVRQLTGGEEHWDSNPSFSPDGRLVVFERYRPSERARHIYRIRIDGSGLRQLTRGRSADSDPSYAPNGRWIAFVSDRKPGGRNDSSNIFSMRPNGRQVQLLVGAPRGEFDPDVSPDGRRIAFASNRDRRVNVFVKRIGRRHPVRQITRSNGACSTDRCYTDPSWAPDGRHIALWRKTKSTTAVVVTRANGPRRDEGARKGVQQGGLLRIHRPPGLGPAPALSGAPGGYDAADV